MFSIEIMPAHLEGLSAAILGRRLAIGSDKPLVIKIATSSRERGQVLIATSDGGYRLTNDSAVPCKINGKVVRSGDLAEGDEVLIGKDLFRMTIIREDEHDRIGTQKMAPTPPGGPAPASTAGTCAVCDAAIADVSAGWSDGRRTICSRCIASGVKPDHLPNTRRRSSGSSQDLAVQVSPPVPDRSRAAATPPLPASAIETPAAPPMVQSRETHAERTPLRTPVLPGGREPTPLGQRIVQGPVAGEALPAAARRASPGTPAGPATSGGDAATPDVPSSESDRMRHSRRISASRLAAVEPAGSGREGLLSKVGRVFGRRDERYQRLEELQSDRLDRLAEAGRLALSPGLGLGLAEEMVVSLVQGQRVTFGASDCSTTGLEHWRALRKRMDLLDAEIAALRHTLGMGPDPDTTLQQSPTLRVDERRQQERAFATLDGLSTDELGKELSQGAVPPQAAGVITPASGRHRQSRRRR